MANAIPPQPPDSMAIVGARISQPASGQREVRLTYQMRFDGQWVAAQVVTVEANDERMVTGASAYHMDQSIEAANAFALAGKSVTHYLVLLAAASVFLFCLYVAVVALRSDLKWKWLWAVVALVGVTKFSLDWSSGATGYHPVSALLLFGISVTKAGPAAPWILSISFPIGAVVTLRRVRSETEDRPSTEPSPGEPGPQDRNGLMSEAGHSGTQP